jgi:ribosomal protein S12 methylthiotransferase accessory factor YcaO
MRSSVLLRKVTLLASCVAFGFGVFSAVAAASAIVTFQERSDAEKASLLVGHWRKTTTVFETPKDEHLVLHANGTAKDWSATAYDRTEPVTGTWKVEGKTLTLLFGDHENSQPFTFYEGQLGFPNIQNGRGFWQKIE